MARYAKDNGVAQRDIGDGIKVTVELTPELKWEVTITGSDSPSQEQIAASYKDLLDTTSQSMLDSVNGAPGPQYGTAQGYVFAYVIAQLKFEQIQAPPEDGGTDGEGNEVVY